MRKMSIEKAVEYSLDKRIVIHTPTQEVYDRLEKYVREHGLDGLGINRFPECEGDTCIDVSATSTQFCKVEYYRDKGYEIIELIDESVKDDTLTITIKSDGHKVVSASCNNITVEAKCNDSDTFNLSKGSHMALNRLIDKMNEPVRKDNSNKIEKGDIVEIISNSIGAWDESIGLQGIITDITRDYFTVTFPVKIYDFYDWDYLSKDLKLIRKAQ